MGAAAEGTETIIKNADEVAKAAGKVLPVIGKAGKDAGKGIVKGAGKVLSFLNPISKTGKSKAGTVGKSLTRAVFHDIVPALAGFGIYKGLTGEKAPEVVPEGIDYAALQEMSSMGGPADPYADLLKKYDEIAKGIVGGSSAPRPQDMTAEYNRLANISNKMGGATLAQMQNLAGLGAQTATGISAGAEAGRQALNDIYAKAAGQVTEASRMAGTEGSSLTPVSGILAALPSQIRESGSTIGDYLKANQLVSAQDAGFLSELAKQQGGSYANQIARQDQVFRMADQARRRSEAQKQAAAAAASSADARLQAQLAALKLRGQIAEKQGYAMLPVTTDYETIASAWDTMTPSNKEVLKKRGIDNKTKYLNAALNDLKTQSNQG
jgi:hypothetical protein